MRIKRLTNPVRVTDHLPVPQRESEGAAGYDLRASIEGGTLTISPGTRARTNRVCMGNPSRYGGDGSTTFRSSCA